MYLSLNPGAVGIKTGGIEEDVLLAKRHGFAGVDVPMSALADDRCADLAAELLTSSSVRASLFPLPANFFSDDEQFQRGLRKLREIAPRAARAGALRTYDHIWSGSNEREFDDNWNWHVERLKRIVDVLAPLGIRMGIEFLGPRTLQSMFKHPFIRQVDDAVRLADAVGPELGIVIDTFHWYTSGGTLDDLRTHVDGRRVVNVHTNDARPDRTRDEQMDMERAMPLETGVVDAAGVLRVLAEKGYDGPVIAEPFQPAVGRLGAMSPDAAAAVVAAALRRLFERADVTPT